MTSPTIERRFASTHKYTFRVPDIRRFVEKRLQGRVLNVCAGPTRLTHAGEIVTNDVDDDIETDLSIDISEPRALESATEGQFDTVVFDPPFSMFQANREYNGNHVGEDGVAKDNIASVVRPGGRVISFGYNSDGLGEKRGFSPTEIVLWNHPGRTNDTITVVERRTSRTLDDYTIRHDT